MQVLETASGAQLVLYDAVCGLWHRLLRLLLKHHQRAVFSFASLQSPIGQTMVERFSGDPGDLHSFYVEIFGRSEECPVPAPHFRSRFVEREFQ